MVVPYEHATMFLRKEERNLATIRPTGHRARKPQQLRQSGNTLEEHRRIVGFTAAGDPVEEVSFVRVRARNERGSPWTRDSWIKNCLPADSVRGLALYAEERRWQESLEGVLNANSKRLCSQNGVFTSRSPSMSLISNRKIERNRNELGVSSESVLSIVQRCRMESKGSNPKYSTLFAANGVTRQPGGVICFPLEETRKG
ncbi:hypothetical protein KM043_006405 [Ampulex compressa]|nr:hypothetical protein KM043_006405 [Ampulex compressa]